MMACGTIIVHNFKVFRVYVGWLIVSCMYISTFYNKCSSLVLKEREDLTPSMCVLGYPEIQETFEM